MGFVGDYGVATLRKVPDFVEDERKFLDGGDDDAGLFAGEGVGELLGVFIDFLDDARRFFELADGVLELPVEDFAVGDDDGFVEDFGVCVVVEG